VRAPRQTMTFNPNEEECVELFCELLRFKTISYEGHKTGENIACVKFLDDLLTKVGFKTQVLTGPATQCKAGEKPVLIGTLQGSKPELPAVLLNSHYDVVPIMAEHWTRPAWEGKRLVEEGEERIYGRGAQDDKCITLQYILALAALKASGFQPTRSVVYTVVPDEEVGGAGMNWLMEQPEFQQLNIGVALDEGLANPDPTMFTSFYGERSAWWFVINAKGPTGHGSRFIEGMATHCLTAFSQQAWNYRKEQKKRLGLGEGCQHCEAKKLGDVTTINLTMMSAGVTPDGGKTYNLNVIPTDAKAGFDMRIAVDQPLLDVKAMVDGWCRAAEKEVGAPEGSLTMGSGVSNALPMVHAVSETEKSVWWETFSNAVSSSIPGGVKVSKEIFPAGTDSRFLRNIGIPAFGFSPMRGCPVLLHEHDEYLPRKQFLEGIQVYCKLIPALTEQEPFKGDEGRPCKKARVAN